MQPPKRFPKAWRNCSDWVTNTGENRGRAALYVNDKKVGEGAVPKTVPLTFGLSEGVTAGRDPSTPVAETYQSPFAFTGKLKKVVME
ncbi:MAG: hypothetical protein U0Y68_07290 [Blastocatellia bacterium]